MRNDVAKTLYISCLFLRKYDLNSVIYPIFYPIASIFTLNLLHPRVLHLISYTTRCYIRPITTRCALSKLLHLEALYVFTYTQGALSEFLHLRMWSIIYKSFTFQGVICDLLHQRCYISSFTPQGALCELLKPRVLYLTFASQGAVSKLLQLKMRYLTF